MSGLGWYVHHHGSGHLRRLQSVAAHLRSPVTVLSSLDRPAGPGPTWVRLPLDTDGAAPRDPDAHGELHWVPLGQPGLAARMAAISAWIEATAPAALVVDASVEVALLARLHGVPVVVMAAPGHRDDPAHRLGYAIAELLIGPWPEWAAPLTPTPRGLRAVGALSLLADLPDTDPVQGSVLLIAGAGGADHEADDVLAAAAASPGTRWTVLGMSASDGPGVRFLGHVPDVCDLAAELRSAEVVVVHAGQNAVADVAAARRPAIVLAQRRPFDEQAATVRVLADAGLAATAAGWPAPAAWPGLLARARSIGAIGWDQWHDGDGPRRAAALIDGLAG